jgi:hypothetical protein
MSRVPPETIRASAGFRPRTCRPGPVEGDQDSAAHRPYGSTTMRLGAAPAAWRDQAAAMPSRPTVSNATARRPETAWSSTVVKASRRCSPVNSLFVYPSTAAEAAQRRGVQTRGLTRRAAELEQAHIVVVRQRLALAVRESQPGAPAASCRAPEGAPADGLEQPLGGLVRPAQGWSGGGRRSRS